MGTHMGQESSACDDNRHVPIRTCIATRNRLPQAQLLRVVAVPNASQVEADPDRIKPGRGCWLTPTLDAFELAEKRKAFSRALRVSTSVDTGPVRQYLTALTLDLDSGKKTEH